MSPYLAVCTISFGTLPLNYQIVSNHGASYCIIDVNAFFKTSEINITTNNNFWWLRISKPVVVYWYLQTFDKLYTKHKIHVKVDIIAQEFNTCTPNDIPNLIDKVNK